MAMVAAVALALGSFLPWVEVSSVFGSIGFSGFDGGDGKLTAAAGVGAFVLFLVGASSRRRGCHLAALVACGLGGATAAYDAVKISNALSRSGSSEFARANVGIGLWVCALGAAAGLGCGLVAMRTSGGDS